MNEAMERDRIAHEIVKDVFELTIVSHDYIMHHEERPKTQWLSKHESLGKLLKQALEEFKDSEEKAIVEDIYQTHESLESVFSQLVMNYEKMNLSGEANAMLLELEERLIGQLSVKSVSMVTLAFQLSKASEAEMMHNHERVYDLTMIFILFMGAIMVITSYGISRSVLKPITQFQKGTEIISEGNLDYQIGITQHDEIGDLAKSFDNMRMKVKDRTTELKAANQQLEASNQQLKASEQQLKATNQQLRASEQEIKKHAHELGERVKELNCMFGVAESICTRDTLEETFQDIAEFLPPSSHYPEITRGKVLFDGKEYVSEPFEETGWKQSSNIIVNGEPQGSIEVYYLEERPEVDEGPFTKEERNLIDGMARNISMAIERNKAEERTKHLNLVLRAVRNVNQLITKEKDRDRLLQHACENFIENRGYYNVWAQSSFLVI